LTVITRLELVLRAYGLKPARVAGRAGYARTHLLRLRQGWNASPRARAAVASAVNEEASRLPVNPGTLGVDDVFEPDRPSFTEVGLIPLQASHEARKVSGTPGDLSPYLKDLSETVFDSLVSRMEADQRVRSESNTRVLLWTAEGLLDVAPRRAVALYELATIFAKSLRSSPPRLRSALLGHGAKGASNALRMSGDYGAAQQALTAAENWFQRAEVCEIELGQTRYTRAAVLFKMERWTEAREVAASALALFQRLGNRERILHARLLLAAIALDAGNVDEAHTAFVALRKPVEASGDASCLARLWLNLAVCELRRRRHWQAAEHWLDRAERAFRRLGLDAEVARATWVRGKLSIASGNENVGMAQLRRAMARFNDLQMPGDAGFVGFDILEQLAPRPGKRRDAEKLAAQLVNTFSQAGAPIAAARALDALRELVATHRFDTQVVRYIAAYVRRAEVYPDEPLQIPQKGVEPS
jgi:tetratricopeptide (TPR) repeat protein